MDWSLIVANLLTPAVLFFALGLAATLLRSDLEIPPPVTRGLSLYLLLSIGMHGGVELSEADVSATTMLPLAGGIVASMLTPLVAFALLRKRLGAADAAAIGATYGSISAVTFLTACSYLEDRGLPWSGTMVAAMALMESPAILVGVWLARRSGVGAEGAGTRGSRSLELVREAFLNGSVFLLIGSLLVGLLAGEKGWRSVAPFTHEPFKGVLCLFLLDMGLVAGRRLGPLRESGPLLLGFAVGFPLVSATLAVIAARAMALGPGDALLFTVLCASASYIAVPAAVRSALPQANPSLFLPMSLAVTFPLNIVLGIPLYMAAIEAVWGGIVILVKRIEIVVDAPHSAQITDVLQRHGLSGWSIVQNVTGSGERGSQLGDELTGVSSNHLILTTCSPEALAPLIEDLRAILVRAGGMCLVSDASWLRH